MDKRNLGSLILSGESRRVSPDSVIKKSLRLAKAPFLRAMSQIFFSSDNP